MPPPTPPKAEVSADPTAVAALSQLYDLKVDPPAVRSKAKSVIALTPDQYGQQAGARLRSLTSASEWTPQARFPRGLGSIGPPIRAAFCLTPPAEGARMSRGLADEGVARPAR